MLLMRTWTKDERPVKGRVKSEQCGAWCAASGAESDLDEIWDERAGCEGKAGERGTVARRTVSPELQAEPALAAVANEVEGDPGSSHRASGVFRC